MKRTSIYSLKCGGTYKLYNKRLEDIIIFKIIGKDIIETSDRNIDIKLIHLYMWENRLIRQDFKQKDLKIFKDDILYEITNSELLLELL